MKHLPLNVMDTYLLAGFKYQLSISTKIAEERFNELMENASDYAKSIAMKWFTK